MRQALTDLVERHIAAGTIPGAVVSVSRAEEGVTVAAGAMALGGPSMPEDAIMRIQSMTKPVTAVATLLLVQAGRLSLDDPVDRWLPELAGRQVLRTPASELDDTVAAERPVTVRDLLTNASGYGIIMSESPLAHAMRQTGVEAGLEPPSSSSGEWLDRLARLPLVGQPGKVFRYHHSFSLLGMLLSRHSGMVLQDFLTDTVFEPLGMSDTGFWVPPSEAHRLPAAYRIEDGQLVESEPLGGGFYLDEPLYDVAHGELVSTAADFNRFARMLATGGMHERQAFLDPGLVTEMTQDQVADEAKTPDSFFPGFWDGTGWGYGVSVVLAGPRAGEFGWAGGQGTDFFVDPTTRTVAILLTQVELGEPMGRVVADFRAVTASGA